MINDRRISKFPNFQIPEQPSSMTLNGIKLAVFDVDGTILNQEHILAPEVVELFHWMHNRGIIVGLATGRTLLMVEHFLKQINLEMPLILLNGAWVHDMSSKEQLLQLNLDKKIASQVVTLLREWGYEIIIQKGIPESHIFYYDTMDESNTERSGRIQRNAFRCHKVDDIMEVLSEDPGEITVLDVRSRIDKCRERLQALHLNMKITYSVSPFNDEYAWLEILHPQAEKGNALRFLAEHWGILQEETLAVGDNYNDVGMIEWGGVGIAVANAVDQAKASADIVLQGEHNGLMMMYDLF